MASSANALPSDLWYTRGAWAWITTTDHKRIGVLYLATSLGFFFFAVTMAMLMRTQLLLPNNTFLSPEAYNQIFTMHGTTMVFLFGMPFLAAIANYFVPLMIGARDMIFPRLNQFGYWAYAAGGFLLYSSFFLGGAPNAGWFSYAPLTIRNYNGGPGMDFWAVGIVMLGVSSIGGAVNVAVTVIRLRAPGMTLRMVPLFVWATFVNQFLILAALPSLTAAAIMLYFDRNFGTAFFNPSLGGDPLLWQHLFWFFGHPEVYILILPVFGVISEVIPVFARKPIYGRTFIAVSTAAIGILGFTVWAHHMFATGLGFAANVFFAFASFTIAVPTAIKMFNWLATMIGGSLRFRPPLLFATGFLTLFLIGGLTGVAIAVVPFDWQVTDSYFIVGHFHNTLFGGTVFGAFAGLYYWYPKITGRMMNEKLAVAHFILMYVGFVVTFGAFHVLGLLGMPRRVYTFADNVGWNDLNFIGSIGAYTIAVSLIIFLINAITSYRRGRVAGPDPWDAWTLEWATESPPGHGNFSGPIPPVRSARPLWDLKNPDQADWKTGH